MRFLQVLTILNSVATAVPMSDTRAATAARLTSVATTATLAVRGESPSVARSYDSLEAKHNGISYAPPVTTTVTETVFSTTTAYDTATTEYLNEFEVLPPVTITVTDHEVIPPVTVTVTDYYVLPPVTVTVTDYISNTPEPNPNNSVAEMTNPLNKRFELSDVWNNTQEESFLKTLDGILTRLLDDEQFAIYQSATKSKVAPFPPEKASRRRMFPYQFGLVTQRFFIRRDKTDPDQIWDEPRQRSYLYASAMVLKPYLSRKEWRTLRNFQAMASGFNETESFSPRLKAAYDLGHLIYDSFPDDLLDVSPYKSLPKSEVILHSYQDVDEVDVLNEKPKGGKKDESKGKDKGESKDQDESKEKSKDNSKDNSKDQDKSKDNSEDKSKDDPKDQSKSKEESKDQDKSDQDSKEQDNSKDDLKSQDDPKDQDKSKDIPKDQDKPKEESKDQDKSKDDPKSQDDPKDPNDKPKDPNDKPKDPPPSETKDKSPESTPEKPTPSSPPPDDDDPPTKPSRKANTESEYGSGAIVLQYDLAQETDSSWVGETANADLDAVLTLAVAAFPQTSLGSTAIRITALPDGRIVSVGLDPAFLSMTNEKRKRDVEGGPFGLGLSGLIPYSHGLGVDVVVNGVQGVGEDTVKVGLRIGDDK